MYLKRNLIIISTLVYVLSSFAIAENLQDLTVEKLFERALETRGDEYAMYRDAIIERDNEAKSFLKGKISDEDPLVGIIAEVILDRMNNPKRYSEYEEAVFNIWHLCEKADSMDQSHGALPPFERFSIAAECEPNWQRCFENFKNPDDIRTAKAEFAKLSKLDAVPFFAETALKNPIRYIKNPPVVSEQMYAKYKDLIEAKFKEEQNTYEGLEHNQILREKLIRAPEEVLRLHKSNMEDYYGRRIFPAYATMRLKCFEDPAIVPVLIELLQNDESIAVRRNAAEGIFDPAGLPYLRDAALNDGSVYVRGSAIRKLVELADVNSFEVLISALSDEGSGIRVFAAKTLGEIGDIRAKEPLKKALLDKERYSFREAHAVALGKIDLDVLLGLLNDKDVSISVRSTVAKSLIYLKDVRSVNHLIKALEDEDRLIRDFSADALGKIKDKRAARYLIKALKSDIHPDVRNSAAEALGEIGDTNAVESLIEALEDKSTAVREESARALEKIGDERALKALEKTKLDKDTMVRIKSQDAIKAINKRLQQKRLKKSDK